MEVEPNNACTPSSASRLVPHPHPTSRTLAGGPILSPSSNAMTRSVRAFHHGCRGTMSDKPTRISSSIFLSGVPDDQVVIIAKNHSDEHESLSGATTGWICTGGRAEVGLTPRGTKLPDWTYRDARLIGWIDPTDG